MTELPPYDAGALFLMWEVCLRKYNSEGDEWCEEKGRIFIEGWVRVMLKSVTLFLVLGLAHGFWLFYWRLERWN